MNDWKHLSEKVKRHVKFSCHVENCLKLAFFGKTNIAEQLSKAYGDSIIQHNLEVEKPTIFCPELLTVSNSVVHLSWHYEVMMKLLLQKTQVCFLVWSTLQQLLILF